MLRDGCDKDGLWESLNRFAMYVTCYAAALRHSSDIKKISSSEFPCTLARVHNPREHDSDTSDLQGLRATPCGRQRVCAGSC